MCPNTSKQIYSVMKAVFDAGNSGLHLDQLRQNVGKVSLERFARDFSSQPVSLSVILRRAIQDGEIALSSGKKLKMTEKGKRSFWYVYRKEIAMLPEPEESEIIEGKSQSTETASKRMQYAIS